MRPAERLERLKRVACVHGTSLGTCPEWFCEQARRAVVRLAAEDQAPGPEMLPQWIVKSSHPFCRWCHQSIRGCLSDRGWAHEATSREQCAQGMSWASPVTDHDQREARRTA